MGIQMKASPVQGAERTLMSQEVGLFETMYTQRALRYLSDRDVSDDLVSKLIEAATKAPSGGDSQPWQFLVIKDPETRQRIAEYYGRSWDLAYGVHAPSPPTIGTGVFRSASHLAKHMAEVPVLILACVEHDGSPGTMGRGSSIYPAVQNLLLAARGLGLGSALTTLHKRYEDEIKDLLGIPDNVETAALLPVGYPADGARYGPTRRRPVQEVTYWERWGSRAPV